jgi:hypothetical protein
MSDHGQSDYSDAVVRLHAAKRRLAAQAAVLRQASAVFKEISAALEAMPERTRFDGAPMEYDFGNTALLRNPEAFDWATFPTREAVAQALSGWNSARAEIKVAEAALRRLEMDHG